MPLIPVYCSSVSSCRHCLHCAMRCSLCSTVSCWPLLPHCSCWIWSWHSHSWRVSVETLSVRGFWATCCACVSFAWEFVRDSPMVNIVSQTMNKHNSLSWIIQENEPWSSAAKFMLPGNAKSSMTPLADTKHIFIERFICLRGIESCRWLRPHAVSRPRVLHALHSSCSTPRHFWREYNGLDKG